MSESICTALYQPNSPRVEWRLNSREEKMYFLDQQSPQQWQHPPATRAAEIQFPLLLGLCWQLQFSWATRHWINDCRTIWYFLGKWVSPIFVFSHFPLFLFHQFQIFFHDADEERRWTVLKSYPAKNPIVERSARHLWKAKDFPVKQLTWKFEEKGDADLKIS